MSGGGGTYAVQGPGAFSPTTLLTLLKMVDGTGSGLDADLLDGQSSAYYRDAGNINAGTLAIARGGTNSGTALSGSSIMVSNGTAIVQGAAGTSTTVLHGNASGAPTYGAVSLTADVSGILPSANGGTGVNNAGTLTNASNTTITGGGTVALGGFTLTVPATGTASLLGTAQTYSALKTFTAGININGGSYAAGTIYTDATAGIVFAGRTGSAYDWTVLNGAGQGILYVPTGTRNMVFQGSIAVLNAVTPASASAAGQQGTIAWDTSYIYICIAPDTWKRVAIATW